jgi:DNA gyrase subunit A
VDIDDLFGAIKGPDFPTGGILCGVAPIRAAYKTGRGQVTIRSRVETEQTRSGKKRLVVTEIPYQIQKNRMIERIASSVKAGRITGITDIRDESDREGLRLVIELKRGEDDQVILNQLFKHSQLQTTFSIIMIALVNGRPQTLDLKQMLEAFRDHRIEVIRRRTEYLLKKALDRAHILEGLLVALDRIDEIIRIIRGSADPAEAKAGLMEALDLSERQAEAILQMRLQKLTGLEREKVQTEYEKLKVDIAYYRQVLDREALVLDIIRKDLHEIKERYADPRRTEISTISTDFDIEDLIPEELVIVTVSHEGYIKRCPLSVYRSQHRGGKGVTGAQPKEGDFIEHLFIASTHSYILVFTDRGKVYWLKVYDVPDLGRTSRGRAIVNLLQLIGHETITSLIPIRSFEDAQELVMATECGVIKKTKLQAFSHPMRRGIIAINLDEGDRLIGVRATNGDQEVVLGTEDGRAIRFHESDVRSMGRPARGVRGIRLKPGDRVRGIVLVEPDTTLLTVCEKGYGKRTPFEEYRITGRGGVGVINIRCSERNGKVIGLRAVREDDEFMLITSQGMVIRTRTSDVSVIGRATQGVKLQTLKPRDKLVALAKVPMEQEEEVDGAEAGGAAGAAEKP